MTRKQYIKHLRNILSYDSMIEILTIADRYWLHREIISNYGNTDAEALVTETPLGHIINVSNKLIEKNWQRPELRYNSFRELEENLNGEWIPFNILNHV